MDQSSVQLDDTSLQASPLSQIDRTDKVETEDYDNLKLTSFKKDQANNNSDLTDHTENSNDLSLLKPIVFGALIALGLMTAVAYVADIQYQKKLQLHNIAIKELVQTTDILKPTSQADANTVSLEEFQDIDENFLQADSNSQSQADEYSLAPAPIDSIAEYIDTGILPKMSDDGLKPFDAYKRPIPFNEAQSKPLVAFALKGFGLSHSLSEKALQSLPKNVTLLMTPYADNIEALSESTRRYGFETWLHMPFENKDFPNSDTGTQTILTRSSLDYNMKRVSWVLSQTTGYSGIYGHVDSTFDTYSAQVKAIFGEIFKRGLGYLDLKSNPHPDIESIALLNDAPYLRADRTITFDNPTDGLDKLTLAALNQQKAIGVLDASPLVLELLPRWINILEEHGYKVVPLSAIHDISK